MKHVIKRDLFSFLSDINEAEQKQISPEQKKELESISKSFLLNYKPKFYKFYKVPAMEKVITNDGITLYGVRYTTTEGRILRFTSKDKSFKTLYGIHVFEKNKLNPTINIVNLNATNQDIIDLIVKKIFVDKSKINEDNSNIGFGTILKAGIANLLTSPIALLQIGFLVWGLYGYFNKKHKEQQVYNDKNLDAEIESFKNNSADENVWKVFAVLTNILDTMILGNRISLTINGKPGLGKTYLIKKRLIHHGLREKRDFIVVKGGIDKESFFELLYEYRNRLIIFDDCDSILGDIDFINILKAITDTTPRRVVSLKLRDGFGQDKVAGQEIQSKTPEVFEFFGKVMIITNLPGSKIDSAIVSRTGLYTIKVDAETMLKRIENMVQNVRPEVPMKYKQEAFEYMKELYAENPQLDFDLRMFIFAIDDRSSGLPNWKELVKSRIIYSDDL